MNAYISKTKDYTIIKLSKIPEWKNFQTFNSTYIGDKLLIEFDKNNLPIKKSKSHLLLEIPKKNIQTIDFLEHKIYCYDEKHILINLNPQIPNTNIQLDRKLERHDIETLKKQIS